MLIVVTNTKCKLSSVITALFSSPTVRIDTVAFVNRILLTI